MLLPSTARETAARFTGLTDERKSELLTHLEATPEHRKAQMISILIENGGQEGKFVAEIFGKEVAGRRDASHNKKASLPSEK